VLEDDDIQATARAFFLAKLANGRVPSVWHGGELDGLRYFALEITGERFLLTADGLVEDPGSADSGMGPGAASQ
jgi:hypothetical protein